MDNNFFKSMKEKADVIFDIRDKHLEMFNNDFDRIKKERPTIEGLTSTLLLLNELVEGYLKRYMVVFEVLKERNTHQKKPLENIILNVIEEDFKKMIFSALAKGKTNE